MQSHSTNFWKAVSFLLAIVVAVILGPRFLADSVGGLAAVVEWLDPNFAWLSQRQHQDLLIFVFVGLMVGAFVVGMEYLRRRQAHERQHGN